MLERRVLLSADALKDLVLAISRDIGYPDPPYWLVREMEVVMINPHWDYTYDFPHLIRLCRKGGGFWWS